MSFERVVSYPSPELMALKRVEELYVEARDGNCFAHITKFVPGERVQGVATFEEADCVLTELQLEEPNGLAGWKWDKNCVRYSTWLFRREIESYPDVRAMFARYVHDPDTHQDEFWVFAVRRDGSITSEDLNLSPEGSGIVPEDRKAEFLRHLQNGILK